MEKILLFLMKSGIFLFKEYGFNFVDSMVSRSFGEDSYVILMNDSIKIRLVSDRDQLFLDFQPIKNCKDWYSIDVVCQYITGEIEKSAELDAHYKIFLSNKMAKVISIFSSEHCLQTIGELKKLERERSIRMFGKGND